MVNHISENAISQTQNDHISERPYKCERFPGFGHDDIDVVHVFFKSPAALLCKYNCHVITTKSHSRPKGANFFGVFGPPNKNPTVFQDLKTEGVSYSK